MLFNSAEYFAFFLATLGAYWALRNRPRPRLWLLLSASYFFYGTFDWRFLGLLFVSTVVDYLAGRALGQEVDPHRRRQILLVSIAVNLGILGFFKYFDFFYGSFAKIAETFGLEAPEAVLRIVLPVGISFYTFQSMSYTIDVYRRHVEPEPDFVVFATYVAFFPQLAAGPIERAKNLIPQLRSLPTRLSAAEAMIAVDLILLGLFRKVVVADNLSPLAADALSRTTVELGETVTRPVHWSTILAGALLFILRVYGDFAGYSALARGFAKLLGVDISRNFLRPVWSRGHGELWRRWHVSLMNWFRDYVYIPLGGNRGGPLRTVRNIAVVFTITGLWHGASWSMVVWGWLLGLFVIVEYLMSRAGIVRPPRDSCFMATGGSYPLRPGSAGAAISSVRVAEAERLSLGVTSGSVKWFVATIFPFALATMIPAVGSLAEAALLWRDLFSFSGGPLRSEILMVLAIALAAVYATDRYELRLERLEDEWRASGGSSETHEPLRRALLPDIVWAVFVAAMVASLVTFPHGAREQFWYFQF
ncbi:MAG: hypothetical protein KatS3mg008_0541 [Acidimicrobiales bacterium]|nr:MAG: hypothetical protein KatS3mg008_0541 [Acidimicrobiales bacterium]